MIALQSVTKQYKDGKVVFSALRDVSLSIQKGEFVSILGPSGSGKSTLMHLIGGLDVPTSGSVEVDGQNLGKLSDKSLARFRNKKIGFVFQFFYLLSTASALDNVMLPLVYNGNSTHRRLIAEKLLEKVGLSEKLKNKPQELSGGEQQRVAIARALANDPDIILADEPTGNLDSETGKEIIKLLLELKQATGKTLIIVTHDEALATRTDRLLRMRDGRIV